MPKSLRNRADLPLAALAVPMFLESILRTTLTSADVFMLSFYSQAAVAASGLANQFSFFLFIMYTMISAGASVLIAQYLGAGRDEEAGEAALGAFMLASLFALVLSLGMAIGVRAILALYRLEGEVELYGVQYLTITGGGSVFVAFNIIQASVLRSYGHAKEAMWSNMTANIINVAGNAIAIPWRRIVKLPLDLYKRLLRLGVPIAGENLSYNIAQIVNSWIIAGFGTAALSANVYAITLVRFVFMPAFNIGNAGQIKTGYLVGAGRFDQAERAVWRYFRLGFAINLAAMVLIYLFHAPLLGFFTQDSATVSLVSTLLLVSFLRETGRVGNIVIIPALKGAGDVVFPALIGIVFMWSVGVGGAWLFGRVLGWGLAGVWLALSADEWIRSLIVAGRWKSGVWRTKAVVKAVPTAGLESA